MNRIRNCSPHTSLCTANNHHIKSQWVISLERLFVLTVSISFRPDKRRLKRQQPMWSGIDWICNKNFSNHRLPIHGLIAIEFAFIYPFSASLNKFVHNLSATNRYDVLHRAYPTFNTVWLCLVPHYPLALKSMWSMSLYTTLDELYRFSGIMSSQIKKKRKKENLKKWRRH